MGRMPPQTNTKMNPLKSKSSSSTDDAAGSDPDESVSFFFISQSAAKQLPLFQYKGEDRSLLYHYVLSPLAAFCVNHLTPRTLAPNSITLIGLVFMIASYCAMWYHAPTLLQVEDAQDLPRWIFLLNGASILIYQTLDNMDGKQARKTGSSSPLGLLFDHGCDAVNSVFGSVNWMVALALNPASGNDTLMCWTMLFGPYALFFFATWEEFYTGELILPIVNGPNEGLVGGALVSFISCFYGPTYWHGHDWWESWILPVLAYLLPASFLNMSWAPRNADLLVIACSMGFVQEITLKVLSVVRKFKSKTLWNLLPFITLCSCSILVGCTDSKVWLEMPRTSLHLCSALFVEMTVELMLAHLTEQDYQPARWILLPLVVFTAAVMSGQVHAGKETADFLLMYATASATYLAFKTLVVVHEICTVLNIWCFDIVTPRTRSTNRATRAKNE
jgi:ethanolaminephosphotransferase